MCLNIPLLPIQIDVRVHLGARHRPLPAFRLSIRILMLIVAITAIFCSLWVWFQTYHGGFAGVSLCSWFLACHPAGATRGQGRHPEFRWL
jgi:hypothetical protein